jgi:hypothetical protein
MSKTPKLKWRRLLPLIFISVAHPVSAQTESPAISLTNPGFENGVSSGWQVISGTVSALPVAAHSGSLGLRLTHDASPSDSSLVSDRFPAQPGNVYQGTFWARAVSGFGAGVYLRFYDADGKMIGMTREEQTALDLGPVEIPKDQTEWKQFLIRKTAPPGTTQVAYYIKTYIGFEVTADFDDFTLAEKPGSEAPPSPTNTNAPAASAPSTNADISPKSPDSASISVVGNPHFYQDGTSAVADVLPAGQELYQTQLYGPFSLVVRGLAPGKYTLVFGNAELGVKNIGYRVFSIKVNGRMAAANVDLVKRFGFARKADLSIPVEPIDGKITVEFIGGTGYFSQPRLSFLRVLDANGGQVAEMTALSQKPRDWDLFGVLGLNPGILDMSAKAPPFPGTYKIHPDEKDKLTAADVVGPDGIVYPDWRQTGIVGGIPVLPATMKIEDFGGRANSDGDSAPALQAAIDRASSQGGGVIALGKGVYYLDHPVFVRSDHVIIRGAGKDRTRLVYRYNDLDSGPVFVSPQPGATVTRDSWIEADADPGDGKLKNLVLFADDRQVGQLAQSTSPEYAVSLMGAKLLNLIGDGPHTLKAVATYSDGRVTTKTLDIVANAKVNGGPLRAPPYNGIGALNFYGVTPFGATFLLAQDAKRGDTSLVVAPGSGLQAGDKIQITAPATLRWNALVKNGCKWGYYRENEYKIQSVEGDKIFLSQALRIDFPKIDGSFVRKIEPIIDCGVEDFTLEQPRNVWINGIVFQNAWNCWARGVRVNKAGHQPILMSPAKFCEIRDCEVNDAWWKGGGSAYVGWERAYDCLMDNMTASDIRHGPIVNWACSGDVIRDSVFHGSDMQWHAGWTNEVLFENCKVESKVGSGGYGNGGWSSPPEDPSHGPEGPRDVVYHCDISSVKLGLWMGGMNENWIIAYNRFVVGAGPAVVARTASFDHIIHDNVFYLSKPSPWAFYLATPDCIGWEVTSNKIYGASTLTGGNAKLALDRDNQLLPAGTEIPGVPKPPVPSIFEWERQQKPLTYSN